jgi:hypothetical protein
VAGVVKLDGAPIADASITFDPVTGGGAVYVAATDSEGKFALAELGDGAAGAPAGSYRVSITTAKPLTSGAIDESTKFSPERVPEAYRGGKLTFEVPASGTSEANFDLRSR